MIETGIQQLLTTTPAITALLGTKVFPVVLPADYPASELPAATLQTISAGPEFNLDGTAVQVKRIDVNVWATRFLDAKNAQDEIAFVLTGFTGTLPDGTTVLEILPGVQTDDYSTDVQVYRSLVEYTVTYSGV